MSIVPDSANVGVPPRNMVFDHDAGRARLPFFEGNVLTNAMFVVFSGVFPDGERFFLDSVRAFRKEIEDPTLKARVSGFIGQEALHGREHERLNRLFAERGLAVAVPERLIRSALAVLKRAPKRQQLAATIFMEHFTAALAEQWLTDARFHATTEPEAMKLWLWHAVEELEHKSVAYDVFEAIGGTRAERAQGAALTLGVVIPAVLAAWAVVFLREARIRDLRDHARGMGLLFGRGGFLTGVVRQLPSFLRPRFHPADHDTRALEAEWHEKLFGDAGLLNAEFRNKAALAA
ncbi:metal-dependent hydrolase [Zavarzinia compransoris]|uniref:metal-dependent hydrolase n=1 Tax=Zavarzinia marina TaxID=2911065 RepID=UPI001F21AA8D|nr:metal-dependent hydrolase [Zavarzinia marina]MCF4165375.1 metal-dependent hydrolase [Zavarzinia marina]